jgi:serine protease Do
MKGRIAVLLAVALTIGAQQQVPRAWLGFGYTLHDFGPNVKVRQWLYVQRVEPNSPALAAGVRVQDAIIAIDSRPVRFANAAAALQYFRGVKVGALVKLTVLRGGETRVLTLRAAELPSMYSQAWKHNESLASRDGKQR